ncbi:MAG: class I SAM-dependent methyltransferase [Candidatus Lokiarchaeota archaeon]|nr:class I SAM-dependent methyltransferase [Candidatus Lokiarchaeota archaeon]
MNKKVESEAGTSLAEDTPRLARDYNDLELREIRLNAYPKGWLRNSEVLKLMELARQVDGQDIIEIGSWLGLSTVVLAHYAPLSTIYAVDPHNGWFSNIGEFWTNCRSYPNIVPIVATSKVARSLFDGFGKVGLVFIDGAHDFESAMHDIATYGALLPRLIAMHDVEPECPETGPRRALGMYQAIHPAFWSHPDRVDGLGVIRRLR